MRILAKYGLKPAKRPKKHSLLSGVAHVSAQHVLGYAYFSFSEEFVDAVGRALPFGLCEEFRAFLKVLYHPTTEKYQIFAMYLGGNIGRLLWEEPDFPYWLGKVRQNSKD